jgi:hypothetical protein
MSSRCRPAGTLRQLPISIKIRLVFFSVSV